MVKGCAKHACKNYTGGRKRGIPPIAEEISMAIGVVTDFGIMESSTWLLAPNILPQMKMLTMPVTVATRMPLIITGRFSFIMRLLLYSGRASATVQGRAES